MKKNKHLFFLCNVTFFLMFLIVFPLVQTVKAEKVFIEGKEGEFATIQDAIDASEDGDTVSVADGTYNENILFRPGKIITLKSVNGAESTFIDGTGKSLSVVTFAADNDSTLYGFTITNGSTSGEGGGVLCGQSSSPPITNCIITNNSASTGVALL
jgi:hypothetical protein